MPAGPPTLTDHATAMLRAAEAAADAVRHAEETLVEMVVEAKRAGACWSQIAACHRHQPPGRQQRFTKHPR